MKTSAVAVAMKPSPRAPEKVQPQIVTHAELFDLGQLEQQYATAREKLNDVERKTKAARLALAQKVLGVDSAEQWKALDPQTLESLMAVREEKGQWRSERKAPPFVFIKTWEARIPSWRDEFVKLRSEAEAERLTAETPKSYAYRVDVVI